MKTLIVFYSRTGTTKKVAEMLAEKLGADTEEIKDTTDRSGVIGFMKSGRDAMKKKLAVIEPITKDPGEYELVVIGTPNWAGHIATPILTYLTEQKDKIKKAAFFCTQGGSGDKKLFSEMKEVLGRESIATFVATTKEVAKGEYQENLEKFVSQILHG